MNQLTYQDSLIFKINALKLSKRHSVDVLYYASKAHPKNTLLGAAFVYAFIAKYTTPVTPPDFSAAVRDAEALEKEMT